MSLIRRVKPGEHIDIDAIGILQKVVVDVILLGQTAVPRVSIHGDFGTIAICMAAINGPGHSAIRVDAPRNISVKHIF